MAAMDEVPLIDDLAALGRTARRGRLPIVLLVSTSDCSYCKKLKDEVLNPMVKSREYDDRALLGELMLDAEEPLRGFGGDYVRRGDVASRFAAGVTPDPALSRPGRHRDRSAHRRGQHHRNVRLLRRQGDRDRPKVDGGGMSGELRASCRRFREIGNPVMRWGIAPREPGNRSRMPPTVAGQARAAEPHGFRGYACSRVEICAVPSPRLCISRRGLE